MIAARSPRTVHAVAGQRDRMLWVAAVTTAVAIVLCLATLPMAVSLALSEFMQAALWGVPFAPVSRTCSPADTYAGSAEISR